MASSEDSSINTNTSSEGSSLSFLQSFVLKSTVLSSGVSNNPDRSENTVMADTATTITIARVSFLCRRVLHDPIYDEIVKSLLRNRQYMTGRVRFADTAPPGDTTKTIPGSHGRAIANQFTLLELPKPVAVVKSALKLLNVSKC